METYAYMIMSVVAGCFLLLMPHIVKKVEKFIASLKSK